MATRTGSAVWEGTLKQGKGTMETQGAARSKALTFHHVSKKQRARIRKSSSARPGRLLLNGTLGKSGKGRSSGEANQHDRDREEPEMVGGGPRSPRSISRLKRKCRGSTRQNFASRPSTQRKPARYLSSWQARRLISMRNWSARRIYFASS